MKDVSDDSQTANGQFTGSLLHIAKSAKVSLINDSCSIDFRFTYP